MRRRMLLAASAALTLTTAAAIRHTRKPSYRDRVVVITGARGLALALAAEFGKRGARIALIARDRRELRDARAKLLALGFDAMTCTADVRDDAHAEGAIGDIVARFGRIDVLVNNAGMITVGPMRAMNRMDYEDSLSTHFWGLYNMVGAAWDALVATRGNIVNITSLGGYLSVPHLMPYSVGKFAAAGFSEGLAAEALRYGITVTTVVPGLMRTGSPINAWFKGDNRAEYAWFDMLDSLPLVSVSASHAARRIADGAGHGMPRVTIGIPARIALRVAALTPNLSTRAMQLAASLLPRGEQHVRQRGLYSVSGTTESPFTALDRKAQRDFNQLR